MSRKRRGPSTFVHRNQGAPLVGSIAVLAGLLARSCEPVKRTPFLMCNRQDESMTLVFLKRDNVWKPLDGRLADNCRCLFSAGPPRKRLGCLADSQQCSINRSHEFHSQAVPSFFIPQRGGAELGNGPQDKDRPARRCSSSLRISVRTVSQATV